MGKSETKEVSKRLDQVKKIISNSVYHDQGNTEKIIFTRSEATLLFSIVSALETLLKK